MKTFKWNYEYEDLQPGERQYDDIDLTETDIVEAKYVESQYDKGNPFIEALPLFRIDNEVDMAYEQPLFQYNKEEIDRMNKKDKINSVSMINNLRVVLPFHRELEMRCYNAIVDSYRKRKLVYNQNNIYPVFVENKEEPISNATFGRIDDSVNSSFGLIGYSGCGKSSSAKICFDNYPQVIIHRPDKDTKIIQIVYLVVCCVPNSNFKVLYENIGYSIDRALGNIKPVYEALVKKAPSLGKKQEVVRELIERFSVGLIVLDEIQLISFDSTKENSYEGLMTLVNRTKVALAVIGTEDAYEKFFKHLRTARRIGKIIDANEYTNNKSYFNYIVYSLFEYQWFDNQVIVTPEIVNCLYKHTHGLIYQLIEIYIAMNIDYIYAKKKPTVNAEFIDEIVKKYYPRLKDLIDNLANVSMYAEIRDEMNYNVRTRVDSMLEKLDAEVKEKSPVEKRKETIDTETKMRNVLSLLRECYTPEQKSDVQIINAIKKVMNVKSNSNKSEADLAIQVKQKLDGTSTPKKKNVKPDMSMMRNAIIG